MTCVGPTWRPFFAPRYSQRAGNGSNNFFVNIREEKALFKPRLAHVPDQQIIFSICETPVRAHLPSCSINNLLSSHGFLADCHHRLKSHNFHPKSPNQRPFDGYWSRPQWNFESNTGKDILSPSSIGRSYAKKLFLQSGRTSASTTDTCPQAVWKPWNRAAILRTNCQCFSLLNIYARCQRNLPTIGLITIGAFCWYFHRRYSFLAETLMHIQGMSLNPSAEWPLTTINSLPLSTRVHRRVLEIFLSCLEGHVLTTRRHRSRSILRQNFVFWLLKNTSGLQ